MISHILAFLVCYGFVMTAFLVKNQPFTLPGRKPNSQIPQSRNPRLSLIHLMLSMATYSFTATVTVMVFCFHNISPEVKKDNPKYPHLINH
jgi:hypothetical protein